MNASCSPEQLESVEKVNRPLYLSITIWDLICCFWNMFITGYAWWMCEHSTAKPNSKKMHRFYFVFTYLYLISHISIETYHLTSRYYFEFSGCDLLVPVSTCVWFRIPQSAYALFFMIFKIGSFYDNVFMGFWEGYKNNSYSQIINGSIMVLFSFSLVSPSLLDDLASNEFQVKCSSLEHKSKLFQAILFSSLLALMFIVAIIFAIWKLYLEYKRYDWNIRLLAKTILCLGSIDQHLKSTSWNIIIIIVAFTWFGGWSLGYVIFDDITASSFLISYSIPTACLVNNVVLLIKYSRCQTTSKAQPINREPVWSCCKRQEVFTSVTARGSTRSSVSRVSLELNSIQ